HLDTWDLKPNAPKEIRGEFRPMQPSVPGISTPEHLPKLGKAARYYTIVRSANHRDNDHAIGAYLTLTGHSHPKNAILGIEPPASPQDLPSVGSVVSKLRPAERPVFSYVTLGDLRHFGNNDSLGQNAGCLGKAFDAFTVPFVRPLHGTLDIPGVTAVLAQPETGRMDVRRHLQQQFAQAAPALEATAGMRELDDATRRAFQLLSSPATRAAFDLGREPRRVREAFGPTHF